MCDGQRWVQSDWGAAAAALQDGKAHLQEQRVDSSEDVEYSTHVTGKELGQRLWTDLQVEWSDVELSRARVGLKVLAKHLPEQSQHLSDKGVSQ